MLTSQPGVQPMENSGSDQAEPLVLFESLKGYKLRVNDLLLMLCGAMVTMVMALVLVSFTQCCCRRQKDKKKGKAAEEEDDDEVYGFKRPARSRSQKSTRSVVTDGGDPEEGIRVSTDTGVDQLAAGQTSDGLGPSVRDRIKAFESHDEKEVVERPPTDGGRPRKKKPKSRAFEDFESAGILIGFGNAPKRRSEEPEEPLEGCEGGEEEGSIDEELAAAMHIPGLSGMGMASSCEASTEGSATPTSPTSKSTEEDEGIHTMESEEDEFAAVQRNSEILKSFRRAPPPKKTRARRSMKRRHHARIDESQMHVEEEGSLERITESHQYSGVSGEDIASYRESSREGSTDECNSHDSGLDKCGSGVGRGGARPRTGSGLLVSPLSDQSPGGVCSPTGSHDSSLTPHTHIITSSAVHSPFTDSQSHLVATTTTSLAQVQLSSGHYRKSAMASDCVRPKTTTSGGAAANIDHRGVLNKLSAGDHAWHFRPKSYHAAVSASTSAPGFKESVAGSSRGGMSSTPPARRKEFKRPGEDSPVLSSASRETHSQHNLSAKPTSDRDNSSPGCRRHQIASELRTDPNSGALRRWCSEHSSLPANNSEGEPSHAADQGAIAREDTSFEDTPDGGRRDESRNSTEGSEDSVTYLHDPSVTSTNDANNLDMKPTYSEYKLSQNVRQLTRSIEQRRHTKPQPSPGPPNPASAANCNPPEVLFLIDKEPTLV